MRSAAGMTMSMGFFPSYQYGMGTEMMILCVFLKPNPTRGFVAVEIITRDVPKFLVSTCTEITRGSEDF